MLSADSLPSLGQSPMSPYSLVASTVRSRRPPPLANQLPTMVSVAPLPLLSVDVGGVEEVDALVVGGVHDRVRVGLGGERAEVHGAEAQAADGEAGTAEVGEFHGSHLAAPRQTHPPSRRIFRESSHLRASRRIFRESS